MTTVLPSYTTSGDTTRWTELWQNSSIGPGMFTLLHRHPIIR
jgi:hypothetical protein